MDVTRLGILQVYLLRCGPCLGDLSMSVVQGLAVVSSCPLGGYTQHCRVYGLLVPRTVYISVGRSPTALAHRSVNTWLRFGEPPLPHRGGEGGGTGGVSAGSRRVPHVQSCTLHRLRHGRASDGRAGAAQ